MKMLYKTLTVSATAAMLFSGACTKATGSTTTPTNTPPTVTQMYTPSDTPTFTPSPTDTPLPTNTPHPTNTPMPITVSPGEIYYLWGLSQSSAPYLVWGAQLRDTMNGSCQGFICDGKDLREYDPAVWHFLGKGEYGQMTFTFDQPLDTFVITYRGIMGFDALSGTTPDGKAVDYGFLADGRLTTSYMDTSNFRMETIGHAEDTFSAVTVPCGMIDPNPNGDNSFNMTNGPGGIIFNFLDRAWGQDTYSTRKGYELNSLTIVSASDSTISSNMMCP
ncbi:MAG: hypothetical protein MUO30_11035 [Anaerolineales bacterium]|nr:hypothetical protein [Anaerolineales bacterium]